jgi:hypothetical protein
LTEGMLRSLLGIVPGSHVRLGFVQVMHDGSRMMSKEVSTVCMYICVTIISVVFLLFHMKIAVKVQCARNMYQSNIRNGSCAYEL